MRTTKGGKEKTTYAMRYGIFEFIVMPFGLSRNGLSTLFIRVQTVVEALNLL